GVHVAGAGCVAVVPGGQGAGGVPPAVVVGGYKDPDQVAVFPVVDRDAVGVAAADVEVRAAVAVGVAAERQIEGGVQGGRGEQAEAQLLQVGVGEADRDVQVAHRGEVRVGDGHRQLRIG